MKNTRSHCSAIIKTGWVGGWGYLLDSSYRLSQSWRIRAVLEAFYFHFSKCHLTCITFAVSGHSVPLLDSQQYKDAMKAGRNMEIHAINAPLPLKAPPTLTIFNSI